MRIRSIVFLACVGQQLSCHRNEISQHLQYAQASTDALANGTTFGDDAAPDASRDAGRRPVEVVMNVKIGTRGDFHSLNYTEHPWEPLPVRLVLNAPYQAWAEDGTYVHVVAFTPTMQPCANADFYLRDRHIGKADANGAFAFRSNVTGSSNQLRVVCQGAANKWYRGELDFSAGRRSPEFERPTVYLQADRGVYRPGQVIRIRALAWNLRGEYVPAANQNVAVWLQDDTATAVTGSRVRTDEDGVGAVELPLAESLAEGSYRLVAEYIPPQQQRSRWSWRPPSDTLGRTEAPIQIRRFQAPVIEIRHSLGEFLTPAMRSVPFTVNLGYVDGSRFESAQLVVTVITDDHRESLPAINVRGTGPTSITLSEAILQRARNAREVKIELSATDPTQRKDTMVRVMRVVENPYQASLELDRNGYAPGEMVDVAVRVVDLYSVVQRNKLVIGNGCGQHPTGRTDESGMVHFRFAMPRSSCEFAVKMEDTVRSIATVNVPMTPVRPMQSRVQEQHVQEQSPVTVTVNFPADVVPAERVVHADLTDSSGAIIDSFLVPIEELNGTYRANTVLRAPTWGSMLVTLYALGVRRSERQNPSKIGLLTDGQSLAVGAISHLEVTLHGMEGEQRPGSQVPLSIDVRRDGQRTNAVLGISIVDRGVISMLDPFEHSPFDRFYDPQQKVLASTGAQTLTWPVVQRTWGSDRYDIGWLPSFGMHAGAENRRDGTVQWRQPTPRSNQNNSNAMLGIVSPFGGIAESDNDGESENGNMSGDAIGDAFGFGGLGATGTGWGGGGTGEGTIGLGNFGTMGHGSGTGSGQGYGAGSGRFSGGEGTQGTGGRRFIRDPSEDPAPSAQLILRTGVDETSLWLPREGHTPSSSSLQIPMPATIGEHQINVLASDRRGGIALARATLVVRQPLSVRADLPETMTQDTPTTVAVVAQNTGNSPVDVDLALRSAHWTVSAVGATHVTIAPHQSATTRFQVTAQQPGTIDYEAELRTGSIVDVLRARTLVRPAGILHSEQRLSMLTASQPMRTTVARGVPNCQGATTQCAAHYQDVRLSVALPESTAWDVALDYAQPLFMGDIRAAAAALDIAHTLGQDRASSSVRAQTDLLTGKAFASIFARSRAGAERREAFGRGLTDAPDIQTLAMVVEALARVSAQGYHLVDPSLDRWVASLEQLPIHTNVERWVAVRAALAQKVKSYEGQWDRNRDEGFMKSAFDPNGALRSAYERLNEGVGTSPRDYAEALRLWACWAKNVDVLPTLTRQARQLLPVVATPDAGPDSVDRGYGPLPADARDEQLKQMILRSARALLSWHQQQVNEPAGGVHQDTVYSTSVALLVLHQLAPAEAQGQLREVSQYLQRNYSRWSAWVDPMASAFALQVLALSGIRQESANAAIVIAVDGREVRRVVVDPRDPWASTLSLRGLSLNEWMTRPESELTVSYTGSLNAQVGLTIERWTR